MSITMRFTNSDLYPYGYLAIAAMGLAYPEKKINIQQAEDEHAIHSLLIFFDASFNNGTTSVMGVDSNEAVMQHAVPFILPQIQKELRQPIDLGMVVHAQRRMKELLNNTHPDGLILARMLDAYSRISQVWDGCDPVVPADIIQELKEIILSVIRIAATEALELRKPAIAVTMRFGAALDMLLDGATDSIARKSWTSERAVTLLSFGVGAGKVLVTESIKPKLWLSWAPSRDDIFATDWICS